MTRDVCERMKSAPRRSKIGERLQILMRHGLERTNLRNFKFITVQMTGRNIFFFAMSQVNQTGR